MTPPDREVICCICASKLKLSDKGEFLVKELSEAKGREEALKAKLEAVYSLLGITAKPGDVPEENKRMGCNHSGPICES